MPKLAAKLFAERGLGAHPASLSRVFLQAGFSLKKLLASESDREDVCDIEARISLAGGRWPPT